MAESRAQPQIHLLTGNLTGVGISASFTASLFHDHFAPRKPIPAERHHDALVGVGDLIGLNHSGDAVICSSNKEFFFQASAYDIGAKSQPV